MKKSLIILIIFTISILSSWVFAHGDHQLGQIHFLTTGKSIAQPYFEKGVMFLHSFQYEEARANFLEAEKLDANFSMAYWGEAMTYNHPLWYEQEYDNAIKALSRFAPTADERVKKAKTQKEKGFMNAVNRLYGKGDKTTRDGNFVDAMRALYRAYPEDDEVAIWYTLALLGSAEAERDTRIYMQAAGIAEDVYARNKTHPGALHYVIHAYDDPIHAPLGLRAARAYAKIAPSASHALHMPSHIFTALGMWDDVIKSNQAAWNAGEKQNKSSDPKMYIIHDLHALHWLTYAHLQKQHFKIAYELTKKMEHIALVTKTPMAKWYYAHMRAAYIIDSGDYNAALQSIDVSNVELSSYANNIYADVLVAKHHNDTQRMQVLLNQLIKATPEKAPQKTYTDYFTAITKSGILTARIIALEIKAEIAQSKQKDKIALDYLHKAEKLEEQVSFGYGPPIPAKPSFELLAALLLQNKQYTAAYQQYILSLKRMPNRYASVHGLERTKQLLIQHHLDVPEGIKPYFHRLILPEYYH